MSALTDDSSLIQNVDFLCLILTIIYTVNLGLIFYFFLFVVPVPQNNLPF